MRGDSLVSFQYGQFGTGFLRSWPLESAMHFDEAVKNRGTNLTIIELTQTGVDSYRQPVYSETSHTEKAFIERKGRERNEPPGILKLDTVRIYLALWAAVDEGGYEVEIEGIRYHIEASIKTDVYLMLEAVRKVD